MTRVCLVGAEDVQLRQQLRSHETAREALATYDLRTPYANTVATETVSLGAAVALLNDLNWYLVRYVDAALVLEPSVSETQWLSRDLATAIRDDEIDPDAADRFLKIYGVAQTENGSDDAADGRPPELVEPMYVAATGGTYPEYDLREVEDTLVVRVTEAEFESV